MTPPNETHPNADDERADTAAPDVFVAVGVLGISGVYVDLEGFATAHDFSGVDADLEGSAAFDYSGIDANLERDAADFEADAFDSFGSYADIESVAASFDFSDVDADLEGSGTAFDFASDDPDHAGFDRVAVYFTPPPPPPPRPK